LAGVDFYTDGACRGNPGPGGWGALLLFGEHEREISWVKGHSGNVGNERVDALANRAIDAMFL
jgi:ribonuclease HI